MARTQSEQYGEIRDGILARSAALFAAKGYPNTSIADLADANGISRGLLYHYFESKEAILREMLHQHLDMMLAEVRAAARQGKDAEARFRNTVRKMVRINAQSQNLQIVLLHDLQNLKPVDRKSIVRKQRDILGVVRTVIQACDEAGRVDTRHLVAHTMMFVGMVNYTYLWYDPDGPVGPDDYADMVADTYLNGLRGG